MAARESTGHFDNDADSMSDNRSACVAPRAVRDLWPRTDTDLGSVLGASEGMVDVRFRADGQWFFGLLELDFTEHQRRSVAGAGAVVSTGLLHALWMLPTQFPVRPEQLPPIKAKRLRNAPAFCSESTEGFERTYSPAGQIRALGVSGRRPQRTLDLTVQLSPIFRRLALVPPMTPGVRDRLSAGARSAGVGLAEEHLGGTELVVPAPAAVRGRPGVYRWWMAELAYEAWLQESTQPVS